ncbi:MAG: MBL fold metallo-hydrolase [Firmicutes bacterium]|nr:MBL fold metallo-hydrolase [Alicyclobacillaceae bacterium]MCL6496154.1 MBL fold metallo-hydrolase [Bacillota bacterium]
MATEGPRRIAPGVYEVPVPVPFSLRRLSAYAVDTDEGWVLIDLGPDLPGARRAWMAAERRLGLRPGRVRVAVVTHAHWEHVGLARWAEERWQAPVALLPADAAWSEALFRSWQGWETLLAHYRQHGVPDIDLARIRRRAERLRLTVHLPSRWLILQHGDAFGHGANRVVILAQPGHTDGNLVAYHPASQILFAGDQILSRVTPNIGYRPGGLADPLGAYLKALPALAALPVQWTWPAHEDPLAALSPRIEALEAHHRQRLEAVRQAVGTGAPAYAVLQALFGPRLTATHLQLALDETLAHLEHLRHHGLLRWRDGRYEPA